MPFVRKLCYLPHTHTLTVSRIGRLDGVAEAGDREPNCTWAGREPGFLGRMRNDGSRL